MCMAPAYHEKNRYCIPRRKKITLFRFCKLLIFNKLQKKIKKNQKKFALCIFSFYCESVIKTEGEAQRRKPTAANTEAVLIVVG